MFKQKHSPIKVAIVFIAVFMLCGLVDATAAEEAGHKESEESQRHRVGLFPGYTYIHDAAEDVGEDEGVWVFTLGVDYVYRFREKWSAGLTVDVEFGDYLVVDNELNRENAVVVCGLVFYELLPRWAVFGGGGVEFEQHKNLAVLRVGTEYEFSLGGDWSAIPVVYTDIKQEFNSYAVALGFVRWF